MGDVTEREEVAARIRRLRARLGLEDNEVVRVAAEVGEQAHRVLLVDAMPPDRAEATRVLATLRERMAAGAELRVVGPEHVEPPKQSFGRRRTPDAGSAMVRLLRSAGWTVVAVERFEVADTGWVDLAAREVVARTHREG